MLFRRTSKHTSQTFVLDISRLRKDLLTGYDRNSRPIQNHQNTTVVNFHVVLKAIELVSDRIYFQHLISKKKKVLLSDQFYVSYLCLKDERTSVLNVHAWSFFVSSTLAL